MAEVQRLNCTPASHTDHAEPGLTPGAHTPPDSPIDQPSEATLHAAMNADLGDSQDITNLTGAPDPPDSPINEPSDDTLQAAMQAELRSPNRASETVQSSPDMDTGPGDVHGNSQGSVITVEASQNTEDMSPDEQLDRLIARGPIFCKWWTSHRHEKVPCC